MFIIKSVKFMQTQVARTKENLKKCLCMKCPSYTFICKMKNMPVNMAAMMKGVENAEHMEGLFCAFGKSKCIDAEKGCICPSCEVYKENGLAKAYFCLAEGGK
jgi:hypothetical protein